MKEKILNQYISELNLDFKNPCCLANKVKICAYLVCCGASVDLGLDLSNKKDKRTGNSGIQLYVGNKQLRALVPFSYISNDNPIKIKMIGNKKHAIIEFDGIKLFRVSLVPEIKIRNQNVNMDFETLIAAIPQIPNSIRGCCYQEVKKACAFCALKKDKIMLSPTTLLSAYKQVINKTGRRPKILLTGGNNFSLDRGLAKYIPYLKKLREFDGKVKIAIEASPPKELENMKKLANLKLDTFSANLEVYSDRFRNEFLPGKSEIKVNEYKNIFNYNKANGVKVFSVLIAGLENEQDTLDGIRYLSEIGVPTNLLCLRSFPGSSLENRERINPVWFLGITKKAILLMDKKGLTNKLSKTSGCGSCGACSMEMNLHRLTKKYGKNILNIF
ncbi:hypothetical protein A2533_02775 [Candidatus Falkowbacteria bacterium RIFOXYD2_FULL_35_9]|uniref:Radical SAM core domain-containing protein n=1 Tax=Candidatus Falkowbacteria bacterium RIFOXYC2_FULL_36_12 TaxID=1798002 RepID=A0A1F5SZJ6_9BACT|nr:MAG: hypothetical protein A2478_04145 [Candidatus Falkowbacteria bacterium RIFOXYC2_FULL_36_12]OGF33819.1 MAG: hypothetical protein A2223_03885 [Candidatus Falkowbacteria bacterium RIFOXYA2_FULL_35_8]OGF46364.1 MAG: hypothetical protein A2533_02775 [Candidatus Falkowbacteria bacterium RIFOXYD2_FULL_35_9]